MKAYTHAVLDFSDSADRVYCSQTVFLGETSSQPCIAPRNLYPALIVNIGLVGRWQALAREPEASSGSAGQIFKFFSSFGATFLQSKRHRVKQFGQFVASSGKL